MNQLTALGIVVGLFTVVSYQPAMIGVIVGISAVGGLLSALLRCAVRN